MPSSQQTTAWPSSQVPPTLAAAAAKRAGELVAEAAAGTPGAVVIPQLPDQEDQGPQDMMLSPFGPGTQLDDGCCFRLHTSQSYTRHSALWSGRERRRGGGFAPLSAAAEEGDEEGIEEDEEDEEFTTPTQDSKVSSLGLLMVPSFVAYVSLEMADRVKNTNTSGREKRWEIGTNFLSREA